MPQRKTVRRVPTPEVQGEDSWIEVKSVTVGDIINVYESTEHRTHWLYRLGAWFGRLLAGRIKRKPPVSQNYTEFCYSTIALVADWNWVDSGGKSLPNPQEDPHVVRRLTDAELKCVMDIVYSSQRDANVKN